MNNTAKQAKEDVLKEYERKKSEIVKLLKQIETGLEKHDHEASSDPGGSMSARHYIADPKKVYSLELQKLQRCFSAIEHAGESISDLEPGWRQVEYLRQLNFLLEKALQVGEIFMQIR